MEYKVKIPKRERLIKALESFGDAWEELKYAWGAEWNNEDLAPEEYPFEGSFDEYKIAEWVASAKADAETFEVEVETVPITYGQIKRTIGWSRFCDVTGGNHYSINEWGEYQDREIFDVEVEHAEILGFI